jgi:FO synthase
MRDRPGPEPRVFGRTVAIARLVLGAEMNLQAPPNLSPGNMELLLDCGINDWGGVSPLTLDFINPESPWPEVERLRAATRSKGLDLRERFAVYPKYAVDPQWHSEEVGRRLRERGDGEGYPGRRSQEAGVRSQ